MNLAQFQIILQKINALDKNINMDGKISSIEKDLMKAYVSQLYEACVDGDAIEQSVPSPVVEKTVTPEPTVHVQTPPEPVQENIAPPTPTPVQETTPIHNPTPVQPVVQAPEEPVQPVAEPVAQVEHKVKEVNERIAAQTKTVADALSQDTGKSINERLAAANAKKTFNDKFTEPVKTSTVPSAPVMVKIPDSLKHLDNTNNTNFSQAQPKVNTPPPPTPTPVVEQKVTPPPAPVAKVTPPPAAPANNVNAAFALFEAATSVENADKWGSTPIADLSKSIGLNDRISMITVLFSNDQHAFNNALTQLNNIGGFEQAKDYMMRNLVTVYNWNEGNKSERAQQFINLVRRRYK
jgi:hypothetical protein